MDENSEVIELEGVSAMPTFKFSVDSKAQDFTLQGASEEKLKEYIQKLADL